eukprot:TRINITY_DN50474_c0_g1_i1.p1 TRINITY_DN50474_c0_g1~~TRINITY_DN50474_c0_g1_i1.p1  ORF type:complete len:385 (-),score=43.33 TRINITY_DN50474_c0_g1_i1:138-1292(-)
MIERDVVYIYVVLDWLGCALSSISTISAVWLLVQIRKQPGRCRLLLRQLVHSTISTALGSFAHALLWAFGALGWERTFGRNGANRVCQAVFRTWRFSSYWSCMVYVHIIIGMLLVGRRQIKWLRWCARSLVVLPPVALLLIVPTLISEDFAVSEGGIVNTCGSNVADQELWALIVLILFCFSLLGYLIVRVAVWKSSPESVIARAHANARLFLLVYLVTYWLMVLDTIGRWPGGLISNVMASMQGFFEVLAYGQLVRRRWSPRTARRVARAAAPSANGASIGGDSLLQSFSVAFDVDSQDRTRDTVDVPSDTRSANEEAERQIAATRERGTPATPAASAIESPSLRYLPSGTPVGSAATTYVEPDEERERLDMLEEFSLWDDMG